MTGTSARNPSGIFKTKNAKNLAIQYDLDIYNINSYPTSKKYVTLYDVKFIVYELWRAYFTYGINKPLLNISKKEELVIYFQIFPEKFN